MSRAQSGRDGGHGVYFFVSYAHVPPVDATSPSTPPDHRVKDFFTRLSTRVSDLSARNTQLGAGLYDQAFDYHADPNDALSWALGAAEVFVPLYSPLYVKPNSWSMGEHTSFATRLRRASADPRGHIQPVLWFPLAPGESAPDDGVESIATDVPLYADLGLGALSDLDQFRDQYEAVVDRLAHQIVRVAENSPIGPSPVPPSSPDLPVDHVDLIIAVLAPTEAEPPRSGPRGRYGSRPSEWAPFSGSRPLPVARAAAAVAERLNVVSRTVDLPDQIEALQNRPITVLLDPWILDMPGGDILVSRTMSSLPKWTVLIVVSETPDSPFAQRGAEVSQELITMLPSGAPLIVTVDQAEQFVNAVPTAVARARRQFLKGLPVTGSGRPRFNSGTSSGRASQEEDTGP